MAREMGLAVTISKDYQWVDFNSVKMGMCMTDSGRRELKQGLGSLNSKCLSYQNLSADGASY